MAPRVSVVMSVFNGRPFLVEAVESVIKQSFTDFEFIIIDDASTDGSSADLAQFASRDSRIVLLVNQENLGLTRSLNKGLAEARGEFVARQDADDISLPRRLEKQVAALNASPDLTLLGTGLCEMDVSGQKGPTSLQPTLEPVIKRKMLFDNAFFHPSVMWRKDVFEKHGLTYDDNLRYGQDFELFSRAVWKLKTANLPEPLIMFRKHSGQISKTRIEDQQALADKISWRNFKSFGLESHFKQEEVALMRKLATRAGGLSPQDRRRQWHLWQKLFSLLETGLSTNESFEWKQVKQVRLKLLRRTLGAPPILGRELASLFTMDPLGTITDLAGIIHNRLVAKKT
jgi:glycosyltransferase involved in cell wall biosynthesis